MPERVFGARRFSYPQHDLAVLFTEDLRRSIEKILVFKKITASETICVNAAEVVFAGAGVTAGPGDVVVLKGDPMFSVSNERIVLFSAEEIFGIFCTKKQVDYFLNDSSDKISMFEVRKKCFYPDPLVTIGEKTA